MQIHMLIQGIGKQSSIVVYTIYIYLLCCIVIFLWQVNFHKNCVLYTELDRHNASTPVIVSSPGSKSACRFPVYLTVFAGIFYAVGMGAYFIYALTRKDPNIG